MTTISSRASLLKSGREPAPLIRRHAGYPDANGRLAPEIVDAFNRVGMFGMWMPEFYINLVDDPPNI